MPDAGISFAGGGFTFVGATNGDQFEIDNVFNGIGDSLGFSGHFSSSGPFAIGPITISGSLQTAPVTGSGTLHITDGVHQLTGTIQWVDITTLGTSGVLNLNGVVNLTGIAYAGASLDLQSLVASGTAEVDLTFQFIPGRTLTQLVATGGFTDFSGTIDGSQVVTTPALITCASNKTVECGTSWNFDPPLSASACCTNLTIDVLSTVSNVVSAPCVITYTRTWQATDCCSNTGTCSQTVTVVNTNPPMITCPTNTIVVALNSNCQLVIPTIQVSATDNCASVCSLKYSQSPAAGTTNYSGNSALVTVTVTDPCGNSNSCHVLVEGVPKAGLVVTWPTNLIVSNCIVPCASNYM